MHTADENDLARHIHQLAGSEKGRDAMRRILDWMDGDGLTLDYANQHAASSLIALCWRHPGSTRDAMRTALGQWNSP